MLDYKLYKSKSDNLILIRDIHGYATCIYAGKSKRFHLGKHMKGNWNWRNFDIISGPVKIKTKSNSENVEFYKNYSGDLLFRFKFGDRFGGVIIGKNIHTNMSTKTKDYLESLGWVKVDEVIFNK